MNVSTLRPRTASELVDAAVRILRQQYGSFLVVSAVAAIPGLLANLLLLASTGWGSDLQALAAQDPFSGPRIGIMLVGFVTYAIAEGVYVRLTADAYHGSPTTPTEALGHVASRLPATAIGQLLRFAAAAIAGVFLLLPGIFVLVRTAAAAQGSVLEEEGPLGGIGRSWSLTKGSFWRVLGGIGLAWLLLFVAMFGLQMLIGILAALTGGQKAVLAVTVVLGSLGSVMVYPIIPIVTTLMYYDLRVRREGLDLELMADDLGAAAPASL